MLGQKMKLGFWTVAAIAVAAVVTLLGAWGVYAATGRMGEPPVELAGSAWVLVQWESGADVSAPDTPAPGASITLLFEEDRLAGSAGCNRYFGGYEVEGEELSVGMIGSTMMACAPEVMEMEARYLAALGATESFRLQDGQLVLHSAAATLTFQADAAAE
jgi:heat shock protein HslJ